MTSKLLKSKLRSVIGKTAGASFIVATVFSGLAAAPAAHGDITLNASGATFPAPLYQRMFVEYNRSHPDVRINYQAIGSGAGIKQFTQGLTDFGASDAAMSDAEMAKVSTGVYLIPMTAGSIVISYNLPGVTQAIRLPRDVYPKIFLGDITNWNDKRIAAANPGVDLPDLPITVAYRADGSGTTFNFSGHLAAVSQEFKDRVGSGKLVKWPVGVGGKGNEGVAALIRQTPGTIGYVEFGYAMQTHLPMAVLQNKDGAFVAPTPQSGSDALGKVKLPDNLRAFVHDPSGKASYPIVTFTWWLCHKSYTNPQTAAAIKKLAHWCLTKGQKYSASLGYLPLPPSVVSRDLARVNEIQP